MRLRVASVAWKLRKIRGDSGYFGHLHDLISSAHDEGAKVVVLPELHVLELLPLAERLNEKFSPNYLVQYADALEEWLTRIATSSEMLIIGGSHFRLDGEAIKNVCAIARPDGTLEIAEKNNLTTYEGEFWRIRPGRGLRMASPDVGVTICYDSEFPESARVLAEAGMRVQCVPSWTETQRGFHRVRWACLSRAIENTIFTIQSSLVGDIGREPVPTSYGSSAIIAPCVEPFPVDAILRETPLNEEGIVVADLDFEALDQARRLGEVRNWEDRHDGDWTLAEPEAETKNPTGELN